MSLNIVGVAAHYHDSSCCLLRDGILIAAAEEERFTRVKHDRSIPRMAFRYCLAEGGITIADVDCVAYYENPQKKLSRLVWMAMNPSISGQRRSRLLSGLNVNRAVDEIRTVLGFDGKVEFVDHHLSHAASSYYYSGFSEAAVLTVDGVGEWATTTYGRCEGSDIELFEEVQFPNSLGLLYSMITAYLGFEVNEGEYKVMGLAPYGRPKYVDQIERLLDIGQNGQYRLDMKYFDFLNEDRMFSDTFVELIGQPPRLPGTELLQFHRDVARSLQSVLEEVLLGKVRYLKGKVTSDNLCMAGGVALNCVANSRILRDGPFKRVFVQPAASDAGGALGAAAIAHRRLSGQAFASGGMLKDVYLGPAYQSEDIVSLLAASSAKFDDFRGREKDLVHAVAERLKAGKIVGWFQGRMEFGPRSLGARSILADPRDPAMRDKINSLVKNRESFRPFAPVVLEEKASEHFELDHASPFMLETWQVKSPLSLPAITHIDGSARVQTVARDSNQRLAALLDEFEGLTGCPILLNTSFNVRGEPIVCTPSDALLCFVRSKLDTLVLEDCLVDSLGISPHWSIFSMKVNPIKPSNVGHEVYTFL